MSKRSAIFAFMMCFPLFMACGGEPEQAATPAFEVEPVGPEETESADLAAASDLLRNGVEVEDGLLAGGQPTPEQLQALADAGYRTIINLRTDGEKGNTDPVAVEELGMSYVSMPIAGAEGLTEENARALSAALDAAEWPVVVHCGSGNRVGALFALEAHYVDGKTAEESIAFGLESGMTRLEPVVRERLADESSQ